MRRLFIAVAFLLFAISIAITEYSLVSNTFERYVTALDTTQFYISQKEFSQTLTLTETISDNWAESKKKLNTFLFHEDVEQIEENLKELSEYAKLKDTEEYIRLCDKTKRQLLKLKLNELPNLQNIL